MTSPRAGVRRAVAVGLLAVVSSLWGCTEDPLTAVDPDDAPGPDVETREARLDVAALASWRDTALAGFALPGEGGLFLLATRDDLRARVLARFPDIPDSVTVFGDTLFEPVDSLRNGSFFLRMDTVASSFPGPPFTIRVHALERSFVAAEASWTEAREGVPWATPGGDLGRLLGSSRVEEVRDTVAVPLAVSTDSLLEAWRESEGEPGIAILVEEPEARIRVTALLLQFDAFARNFPDGTRILRSPNPGVFIYDPPQPPAGRALRIGGLPAWRSYVAFRLPETVEGIRLRDATVNHAELVLHPLARPSSTFVPDAPLRGQGIELLGDPFALGAKTPIGAAGQATLTLDPDSLEAGDPVRVDITAPIAERLQELEGDGASGFVRIGIRGVPDAQGLGFWDFASVEHPDPALRPELLLILTPPPPFGVP